MKNRVLRYIIRFLVGEDIPGEWVETIGYTADPDKFDQYNVVIIPSGFFDEQVYGKQASLPKLPLEKIEGIPFLFGTPEVERVKATWVIHADIIASTYFLISRYEEMLRRELRDEHGRFPGKESILYKAGAFHRPIVDEYRIFLRRWLRQSNIPLPEIEPRARKIYLTHDVDAPTLYRSWKGFIRSIKARGLYKSLKGKFGPLEEDPYYTFPWLFQQNGTLRDVVGKERYHSILFFRSGGKSGFDKPHYNLKNKDIRRLMENAGEQDMTIGLHASYQAGADPSLIIKEKRRLEQITKGEIRFNRNHFLASREPEDMDILEAAGITDDFTMGYADIAGFRLGTCYPVRWINPVTRCLSSLTLHPLIIMDNSLSESKYMGLNHDQALAYCLNLAEAVNKVGGELTLLWHNDTIPKGSGGYLRKLYVQLLKELAKK